MAVTVGPVRGVHDPAEPATIMVSTVIAPDEPVDGSERTSRVALPVLVVALNTVGLESAGRETKPDPILFRVTVPSIEDSEGKDAISNIAAD